jgi:hypothetical protein
MTSPYATGRRGVQYGGRVSGSGSAQGSEDLLKLSKKLKAAGQKELRKEFHKAMRDAAKPVIPKIRKAARDDLPSAGGLNQRIARKPLRSQVRTGAKTAGVRIAGSKVDPRINQGRVWHPIFGRKGKPKNGGRNSVVQRIPSADGYFDDTIREEASEIRAALRSALDDWTQRVFG